jgi:hypothetical protein
MFFFSQLGLHCKIMCIAHCKPLKSTCTLQTKTMCTLCSKPHVHCKACGMIINFVSTVKQHVYSVVHVCIFCYLIYSYDLVKMFTFTPKTGLYTYVFNLWLQLFTYVHCETLSNCTNKISWHIFLLWKFICRFMYLHCILVRALFTEIIVHIHTHSISTILETCL